MLKICIFEGFKIEQPNRLDQDVKYLEQNYYVTSRLVPPHLRSALENGVRTQLVKSN